MKTIVQKIVGTGCVFLLLVASACAQYTYPQAQIGQSQVDDGPIVLGDGSLITKNTVVVAATLVNLTTGDLLDTILPSDLIWTRTVSSGANAGVYRMYRVNHSPAVAKDDEVLLTINGTPASLFIVREYVLYGIYTIWDLFKTADF